MLSVETLRKYAANRDPAEMSCQQETFSPQGGERRKRGAFLVVFQWDRPSEENEAGLAMLWGNLTLAQPDMPLKIPPVKRQTGGPQDTW